MTSKLERLLHTLGDVAYEEMLRYYETPQMEGICLETTRCLRVVLRHFGFEASPVSIFIAIHNPVCTKLLLENSHLPPAELQRLLEASWDKGGWSTGTRAQTANDATIDPNRGYNAHLVLRCQDVLIDGSIQQYARPQHNINFPGCMLITRVPPTFFRRGQSVRNMVNDCLLVLEYAGDQNFRGMPGWSRQGGANSKAAHDRIERKIVNTIIARVKANRKADREPAEAARKPKNAAAI